MPDRLGRMAPFGSAVRRGVVAALTLFLVVQNPSLPRVELDPLRFGS